jgi:DinB family protein
MRYLQLAPADREALMTTLVAMPSYLRDTFAALDVEQAREPGPDGTFSAVEQVWHLADLEREGFAERIARLLAEDAPRLPDFDGDRIAAERDYRSKSLADGLAAFATARAENLARLAAIAGDAWNRRGTQDGIGDVGLCDIPVFMAQHDDAHRSEIEAWRKWTARADRSRS